MFYPSFRVMLPQIEYEAVNNINFWLMLLFEILLFLLRLLGPNITYMALYMCLIVYTFYKYSTMVIYVFW